MKNLFVFLFIALIGNCSFKLWAQEETTTSEEYEYEEFVPFKKTAVNIGGEGLITKNWYEYKSRGNEPLNSGSFQISTFINQNILGRFDFIANTRIILGVDTFENNRKNRNLYLEYIGALYMELNTSVGDIRFGNTPKTNVFISDLTLVENLYLPLSKRNGFAYADIGVGFINKNIGLGANLSRNQFSKKGWEWEVLFSKENILPNIKGGELAFIKSFGTDGPEKIKYTQFIGSVKTDFLDFLKMEVSGFYRNTSKKIFLNTNDTIPSNDSSYTKEYPAFGVYLEAGIYQDVDEKVLLNLYGFLDIYKNRLDPLYINRPVFTGPKNTRTGVGLRMETNKIKTDLIMFHNVGTLEKSANILINVAYKIE